MSMTWCSEYSAVPRCLPARSAIRCRSVDRFVGFSVPSHVSLQRFSPRDASLPSVGSQRARFPDFAGTMKALRPPPQACPGPLWVRFQAPQAPLCSCSPKRLALLSNFGPGVLTDFGPPAVPQPTVSRSYRGLGMDRKAKVDLFEQL